MSEGQALSAFLAWTITGALFFSALAVVYQRRRISWQEMVVFITGSMLLAFAGAIAATHAIVQPDGAMPAPWLTVIIICRAMAASIFLGLLIMLTDRPRWLVRRGRKWLAKQGGPRPTDHIG
jgi:MFS family permease